MESELQNSKEKALFWGVMALNSFLMDCKSCNEKTGELVSILLSSPIAQGFDNCIPDRMFGDLKSIILYKKKEVKCMLGSISCVFGQVTNIEYAAPLL